MNRFFLLIFIGSLLSSAPLKDAEILEFIDARYGGDDSTVYSMITENFQFFHTPYIGLGIFTTYQNGSLLITEIVNDSVQIHLKTGDKIHEINGEVVFRNSPKILGKLGEIQKLIVTKSGDSTFKEILTPLIQVQHSQNDFFFLLDMDVYSNTWHDYHIDILEIVSEKDKASVYYHWEGAKTEGGNVFHFNAMEIIYIEKKTDLIYKIESLWSEKQFRDQFK